MNYNIGDIVFALEGIKESNKDTVKNHLFVIIDDDGTAVPVEYFGFVISSNMNKANNNSNYKYNEIILKNDVNKLKSNSIVKCDQLMSIPKENINMKIGIVEPGDLIRFLKAFNEYLDSI